MYSSLNTISSIGSLTSIVGVFVMMLVVLHSIFFANNVKENNLWYCQKPLSIFLSKTEKLYFIPKYNFFNFFIPFFSYNIYLHNLVLVFFLDGYLY